VLEEKGRAFMSLAQFAADQNNTKNEVNV